MNNFQVGDVVRVANKTIHYFGDGELIVSKVEDGGFTQWVSIEGHPQDGSATYMARVFELVSSGITENE